jgi:hypothetical protein
MLLKGLSGIAITIRNLHSDTLSYYNRLIGNGGTITDTDLRAVDTFVRSAYTNGLRATSGTQRLLQFCPYAGNNLAASLTNLWFPSSGKSINTHTGLVEADYTKTTGLTGASTKLIGTGFIPSVHLNTTEGGLGIYNRTAGIQTSPEIHSQNSASQSFGIYINSDGNTYVDSFDESTGELFVQSPTSLLGFFCSSRVSTTINLYVRGTSFATRMLVTGSLPTIEATANRNARSIGCFSFHNALTAAQVTSLTNQVNTLMTAFGRNV